MPTNSNAPEGPAAQGSNSQPDHLAQARQNHGRLRTKAKFFHPSSEFASQLRNISISILDMFPISSDLDPAEIQEVTRSMLPSASKVFTADNFTAASFPMKLLYDICGMYGILRVPGDLFQALDERTKKNTGALMFVWMWTCSFGTLDNNGMLTMLKSFYQCHNLSFNRVSEENSARISRQGPATSTAEPLAITPNNASQLPLPCPPEQPIPPPDTPLDVNHTEGSMVKNHDVTKRATAVVQYFRDRYFKGDIRQSINRTIRDYNVCSEQFNLNQHEKAIYFINVLESPARDFFFDQYKTGMTFENICDLMRMEYDSATRQATVQAELETLRLDTFMMQRELSSTSLGLEKLIIEINSLSPQAPPSFRDDEHKIRCLRRALLSAPWAQNAISQISSSNYSFNRFVLALREGLQLAEETGQLSLAISQPGTFYQQRYGRYPPNTRRNFFRKQGPPPGGRRVAPSDAKCFKCGKRGHFFRNCPSTANLRNSIRSRLRDGTSAVHLIHDMINHLETDDDDTPAPTHFTDDAAEFDELCAADDPVDGDIEDDSPEVDEEIATNHIRTHFALSNPQTPFVHSFDSSDVGLKFFRQADD